MGFEYEASFESIANLLCPICHAPFSEPWISTACEHFYCKTCVLKHLESSTLCPCCRLDIGTNVAPAPRLVKLLCDELLVTCNGCASWKGQRADWAIHARDECGKVKTDCHNGCGKTSFDSEEARKKHQTAECPRRSVICEMCKASCKHDSLDLHLKQCPAIRAACPHCSKADLTRPALSEHISQECPEAIVPCRHARFGCDWSGKRKLLVEEHLALDCPYEPLKGLLSRNESTIQGLQRDNRELQEEVSSLRALYQTLAQRVDTLVNQIGHQESENQSSTQPILQTISSLSSQITNLSVSAEQARRASDQSMHDMRSDLNALQMAMHDIRGEMMAMSQAQYYETASRYWAKTHGGQDGAISSASSSGSRGSNPVKALSSSALPTSSITGAGQMPSLPYPPYLYPSYSPSMYGGAHPPHPGFFMHGPRRFYGWPNPAPGQTSPDGGPGGGTKL